jgi:hypothetical protein
VPPTFAPTTAGYSGFPASGLDSRERRFRSGDASRRLERDEPGEKCGGLLNRTSITQHNYGAAGQLTVRSNANLTRNQFTVGGAFDRSTAAFAQSSQLGYLNPDRSVNPIAGAMEDGIAAGSVDGIPLDNRVALDEGHADRERVRDEHDLRCRQVARHALGTLQPHTTVSNADRLAPAAGPGSLTGSNTFNRFNPARA